MVSSAAAGANADTLLDAVLVARDGDAFDVARLREAGPAALPGVGLDAEAASLRDVLLGVRFSVRDDVFWGRGGIV
jgi:hypothetical protein